MDKRGYNCQEAAQYLGIKRRAFDKYFRPFLKSTRIGTSLIFDQLDLNHILEEHIHWNGRPMEKGDNTWAKLKPVSARISRASGVSIGSTKVLDFVTVSSLLKKHKAG